MGVGQVGQVDVDRQARHVPFEQVDRRPAFERENGLGHDEREEVEKEPDLIAISISRHWQPALWAAGVYIWGRSAPCARGCDPRCRDRGAPHPDDA